jgi:glutathione S-transferase
MKLYDFAPSHNCYKIRLLLAILGVSYRREPVDLMTGGGRKPDFLALNPRGQVPVLEDDGEAIWESTAILVYLARQYGEPDWLPCEACAVARVARWLAVAQNELLYGLGRAHWLSRGGRGDVEEAVRRGRRGAVGTWLAAPHVTIADIACYPHASLAPEAGIELDDYPNVMRWCRSVEAIPGYITLHE